MTRTRIQPLMLGLALAVSGCAQGGGLFGGGSASQPQFIAGNSSEVLVDLRNSQESDVSAARQLAVQKCGLFGKTSAVLQSINPVSDHRDRATFTCE